ncbi:MAG: SLC13 family permease, partial [Deltaproteobacteria bacterium]|nr:SLC13 family permease [Deltaproteobacteria bacterium]
AATIIGNPQNMLIGQVGHLHFGRFLLWCTPPALLALAGAYGILCRTYHGRFATPSIPQTMEQTPEWPEFDPWQSAKGITAMLLLVGLFFTSIPRELSAITVAGILLCSRKMHSRQIMELVDWHLLTLFCALFIVVHGITTRNIPSLIMETMVQQGLTITNLFALTGISTIMSNLVSNVPAAMLLVRFLDPGVPEQWYVLALSSTFAGNLIIIGSIANLIVIEQAKKFHIEIGFKEHARVGIPITLFSLLVLVLLLYLRNTRVLSHGNISHEKPLAFRSKRRKTCGRQRLAAPICPDLRQPCPGAGHHLRPADRLSGRQQNQTKIFRSRTAPEAFRPTPRCRAAPCCAFALAFPANDLAAGRHGGRMAAQSAHHCRQSAGGLDCDQDRLPVF